MRTNRELLLLVCNLSLHLVLLGLAVSLETTLLSSWFFMPQLDIWILSLVFLSLHRKIESSMIFSVLASFALSSFCVIPLSHLILNLLLLVWLIHLAKTRTFSGQFHYFFVASGAAVLGFYVLLFLTSFLLDGPSISRPKVLLWLGSALLTPLMGLLFRPILCWIDRITEVNSPFGFEAR